MQLIGNKKELLEIDKKKPLLTIYHSEPKISPKIFCRFI